MCFIRDVTMEIRSKASESGPIRNVAVYLGSAESRDPGFRQAAVDLADYLAGHGMTLIFGGSNAGMMKILADAMLQKKGRVIGIFVRCLPERLIRNDLTESVITDTLAERKAEMLKRADAVIAFPGSFGTLDELFDALAQSKLGAVRCPIGVLNVNGFFDPLFALLRNSVDAGFTSARTAALLRCGATPEELLEDLESAKNGSPGTPWRAE